MAQELAEGDVYNRILSFVVRETNTRRSLTEQTDIARDLGVDGDDAVEFLQRFQSEFGVDMSGFRFDQYFGGEGFSLIGFLRGLSSAARKKPLTIKMLCDVVARGRWTAGLP
ncbi:MULTISPECIES: DUF1493 family protein [unclassified Bradyrhizobium]|uniref:DUF1493 family protein n=1 Tax=unclassified Bradyrhizobium TaxID=2631580 RepID=UPI0039656CF1